MTVPVTVRLAVPLTPLKVAFTAAVPALAPVANPLALMLATDAEETDHVALAVTVFVEPSLYVAVAANCCVLPTAMLADPGETETDLSVLGGGEVEVEVEDTL